MRPRFGTSLVGKIWCPLHLTVHEKWTTFRTQIKSKGELLAWDYVFSTTCWCSLKEKKSNDIWVWSDEHGGNLVEDRIPIKRLDVILWTRPSKMRWWKSETMQTWNMIRWKRARRGMKHPFDGKERGAHKIASEFIIGVAWLICNGDCSISSYK